MQAGAGTRSPLSPLRMVNASCECIASSDPTEHKLHCLTDSECGFRNGSGGGIRPAECGTYYDG